MITEAKRKRAESEFVDELINLKKNFSSRKKYRKRIRQARIRFWNGLGEANKDLAMSS